VDAQQQVWHTESDFYDKSSHRSDPIREQHKLSHFKLARCYQLESEEPVI